MTDILNLGEDIKKYLSEDARKEAETKLYDFFIRIFSEARRVAVDEKKGDVDIIISRDNWLKGYWSAIRSLSLKKRRPNWSSLTRLSSFLLPILIGYAFSDPKTMYWLIIRVYPIYSYI